MTVVKIGRIAIDNSGAISCATQRCRGRNRGINEAFGPIQSFKEEIKASPVLRFCKLYRSTVFGIRFCKSDRGVSLRAGDGLPNYHALSQLFKFDYGCKKLLLEQ